MVSGQIKLANCRELTNKGRGLTVIRISKSHNTRHRIFASGKPLKFWTDQIASRHLDQTSHDIQLGYSRQNYFNL